MKWKTLKLLAIAAIIGTVALVRAVDLSYPTLVPQTDDNALVRQSKRDIATARMASGYLYTNLTTVGTNAIQWIIPATTNLYTNIVGSVTNVSTNIVAAVTNIATVLRSVVINQAGTNSQLVLLDGSTVIGTLPTTSAGVWSYNVLATNGITVRNTGTSGGVGNITLTFY